MFQANRKKFTTLAGISLVLMAFYLSGCATPMALSEKTKTLNIDQKSIAILTLKTSNEYVPSYQPNVDIIQVSTKERKPSEKYYRFEVDDPYSEVKKQFNEYMVSMELPPGNYTLRQVFCKSGIFPVRGAFVIPVYTDFELKPNEVVYLGRIEAVNRKRTNANELRAGPIIPLFDQAAVGASGGTFDIRIYDNFDVDLTLFKKMCPVINNCNVRVNILHK
jgi:hypothetical protein